MKRSKPINTSPKQLPVVPPKLNSKRQLLALQRQMAALLFRPLTPQSRMQKAAMDGVSTNQLVAQFVKPNRLLTAFERLEIYNRQYWFRLLDSFYDDYPGLRKVLGDRVFLQMTEAYLTRYPSESWTMRNLGQRLVRFLKAEPQWAKGKQQLALEVASFEWAKIEAFDNASLPSLEMDTLLGASPDEVRLVLQPHLQLLKFSYPVDEFVMAIRKNDNLRGDASNAKEQAPRVMKLKKVSLPELRPTQLVVYRLDNAIYYKNLELEAYRLLKALQDGETLTVACEKAFRGWKGNADPSESLQAWFQNWSALGWFSGLR